MFGEGNGPGAAREGGAGAGAGGVPAAVVVLLGLFALGGSGFLAHTYRGVKLSCARSRGACALDEDYVVYKRSRSLPLDEVQALAIAPPLPEPARSTSRLSMRYRLVLETEDGALPVSRRHVAATVEPWPARFAAFQRGEAGDALAVDLDARPDAFGLARGAGGFVLLAAAMGFVARKRSRAVRGAEG